MSATRITVAGEAPYPVLVGSGLLDQVPGLIGPGAAQVLIVHSPAMGAVVQALQGPLAAAGYRTTPFELPDGEQGKTISVIAAAWEVLGEQAFGRQDVILGVGGGAVTDAAGFIAATWLRGVGVVHLPTTLLAMVDAAVGGKTGINTAAGKNLVGAFHSPHGVICDLDLLATLPPADLRAGMAEIVKCGFIADEQILTVIEANPRAAADPSSPVLAELVHRAITVKADVVGSDLREAGLREVLNYGHTFGHAIEQVEDFRWRHGDAVAVGMVFAAELAHLTGSLDGAMVQRHRSILTTLGLPTAYPPDRWEQLSDAMRRDKKARAGTLRFVVLEGVAAPVRLTGPEQSVLRRAYDAVSQPPV